MMSSSSFSAEKPSEDKVNGHAVNVSIGRKYEETYHDCINWQVVSKGSYHGKPNVPYFFENELNVACKHVNKIQNLCNLYIDTILPTTTCFSHAVETNAFPYSPVNKKGEVYRPGLFCGYRAAKRAEENVIYFHVLKSS